MALNISKPIFVQKPENKRAINSIINGKRISTNQLTGEFRRFIMAYERGELRPNPNWIKDPELRRIAKQLNEV